MHATVIEGRGTGWLPDLPSIRDYTLESQEVEQLFTKVGVSTELSSPSKAPKAAKLSLPSKIDLRKDCSPIEDQGSIGSCTAHAGVGMVEYFERRAFGRHIDGSRLFLYKATRNLLRWTGDTGAYLRSTMGAIRLFGVLPEEYWPYIVNKYDHEPPAFCYQFASNYQAINYVRLDAAGIAKTALLDSIKDNLSKGLPSMFGFTVYESIRQASKTGKIPFPCKTERVDGGHAIMAVGYDDDLKIRNNSCLPETTGAFLIRNSWGTGWGDEGYGWLPYEYVLNDLAVDWWTIIKTEWVDTGQFGR